MLISWTVLQLEVDTTANIIFTRVQWQADKSTIIFKRHCFLMLRRVELDVYVHRACHIGLESFEQIGN